MRVLRCGERTVDLSVPRVMGILNITPDSFSDGGELLDANGKPDLAAVRARGEAMCAAGAAFIDVGGESTRPGARAPAVEDELARVVPVVEVLADLPLVISVDTSEPQVMRAAVRAGASMINDVRAFDRPGGLQAAAESNAAVCVMHMRGSPLDMQVSPHYADVVEQVIDFLRARVEICEKHAIGRERIAVDPGFGFGKTISHNLELLRRLGQLGELNLPILVGLSRKSTIGALTAQPNPKDRVGGSVAAALLAAERGARIIRVHDVRETVDALAMLNAIANDVKVGNGARERALGE